MKLLRYFRSVWASIPSDEREDRRTRWVLTLLSFLMLSFLMFAGFIAAMFKGDEIALACIDLVKHLSYVFAGTISCYYMAESFFPSSDRPYWGGGGSVVNVFKRKGQDQGSPSDLSQPPVSPDSADSQVD